MTSNLQIAHNEENQFPTNRKKKKRFHHKLNAGGGPIIFYVPASRRYRIPIVLGSRQKIMSTFRIGNDRQYRQLCCPSFKCHSYLTNER